MRAYERLLNYVSVWTTSEEESGTVPSAEREFVLAYKLVEEMKQIGIADAEADDMCYVYGTIPATPGYESRDAIGLIAHLDTAPDFSGKDIRPQILENYDGEDVVLGTSGRVLSVAEFPYLKKMKGRTLITTDGTTLLGADDKAGIAEIMTVAEEIIREGIPHGKICLAFTPDEEIARSTLHFDVQRFGAKYAYTVDGSKEGEIQYENFNAATAVFTIHGVNVHPGSAKNIMVNAQLLGMELQRQLPENERPDTTEGYEGFYHLVHSEGSVELATYKYIIRDHDGEKFEARKALLRDLQRIMNGVYGEGTVELEITDVYRNMREQIEPCFHLVENAIEAIRKVGVEPDESPVRGGTDGATLSFKGLPCPNLGTGGFAFHGPYEHISVEGMDLTVQIVKEILRSYAS